MLDMGGVKDLTLEPCTFLMALCVSPNRSTVPVPHGICGWICGTGVNGKAGWVPGLLPTLLPSPESETSGGDNARGECETGERDKFFCERRIPRTTSSALPPPVGDRAVPCGSSWTSLTRWLLGQMLRGAGGVSAPKVLPCPDSEVGGGDNARGERDRVPRSGSAAPPPFGQPFSDGVGH